MRELEWEVFHHTAERIRHGIARHLRLTNRRVAPHPKHAPRRVTVDLAKVTAEAWGPIDDITRAIDRQRIAEQAARMHGAGGLF